MTLRGLTSSRLNSALRFGFLCLVPIVVTAQAQERSPSALISRLTLQSDVWPGPRHALGFTCGSLGVEASANRTMAKDLVMFGFSAVSEIEVALTSIEKQGESSPFYYNKEWLLYSYARIAGASASTRLRRMVSNPVVRFIETQLDVAIANSLGLTSYVDSYRIPGGVICRVQEPRDALDQLILAWEQDDQTRLRAVLGPNATMALQSLLAQMDWVHLRTDLWQGKSSHNLAVGYRFTISGHWSEPEETLEEKREVPLPINPELDSMFMDSSGNRCGEQRIKFLSPVETSALPPPYRVDNSDLANLLRLISSCASSARPNTDLKDH